MKSVTDVNFAKLPIIYSHQLDIPWMHIDDSGKKRKAAQICEDQQDEQEGMQEIKHSTHHQPPCHYLWVEMCNQLYTPISGSNGLNNS
jgi:hypothetical protein